MSLSEILLFYVVTLVQAGQIPATPSPPFDIFDPTFLFLLRTSLENFLIFIVYGFGSVWVYLVWIQAFAIVGWLL